MNYRTLILIACTIFLFSCNNKKDENSPSSDNIISFKADGELVQTEGWNVNRFKFDSNSTEIMMNITSNMHKDKRTILVNLAGADSGTYTLTGSNSSDDSAGSYKPDYFGNENYTFTSGEFDLTEVDLNENIVNGTFFGVTENADGDIINITEGKLINLTLKEGITVINP